MHTHNIDRAERSRGLTARQAAFDQTFAVGSGSGPRYRESSKYRESDRYGDRYSVGATTGASGAGLAPAYTAAVSGGPCYDVSTGTILGGPMHGIKPPPGTVTVVGNTAHLSISGDVYEQMPICRTGNGNGNGNGGGKGVGQPGCDPCWTTGGAAGHGRPFRQYANGYKCAIKPPRCDCHVIGGNTLNSTDFPAGVPSGTFGFVLLDSGDASFFVPHYMHIVAFEVGDPANAEVTGNPLLVLMQDSKSGQEPNMRRASTTNPAFGVPTTVYGFEKMLECVDWHRFASVNNQQLRITFFNPNTVAVHVFVDLWGLPAA